MIVNKNKYLYLYYVIYITLPCTLILKCAFMSMFSVKTIHMIKKKDGGQIFEHVLLRGKIKSGVVCHVC